MRYLLILFFFLNIGLCSFGQNRNLESKITSDISGLQIAPNVENRKIAITIDDVPNTKKFQADNDHSYLLETLDSLNIPISIFINEGLIYKTSDTSKNLALLEDWTKNEYVTLGNHTFSHFRYSDVGYHKFKADIDNGEIITRRLAHKFNKPLDYFRFPYNDLGIDSIQHLRMDSLLRTMSYKIAPFTVESSDWMFNAVYEYYLSNSAFEEAAKIGDLYISKTIDYIHFFDSLSNIVYGRDINQIYLCHDNTINSVHLKKIIQILEQEGYQFVSIDEAMQDPVYHQKNNYFKKWGVSWLYRLMSNQNERIGWMKLEPDISAIEKLYEELFDEK